MTPQTHTVERVYQTGGGWKAAVRGFDRPLECDSTLQPGHAVIISGNRAERYFNTKDQ